MSLSSELTVSFVFYFCSGQFHQTRVNISLNWMCCDLNVCNKAFVVQFIRVNNLFFTCECNENLTAKMRKSALYFCSIAVGDFLVVFAKNSALVQ